jgi:hypothetical protein
VSTYTRSRYVSELYYRAQLVVGVVTRGQEPQKELESQRTASLEHEGAVKNKDWDKRLGVLQTMVGVLLYMSYLAQAGSAIRLVAEHAEIGHILRHGYVTCSVRGHGMNSCKVRHIIPEPGTTLAESDYWLLLCC